MRIVSLIPSATEIVAALGAEAEIVGRSHECAFPSAIACLTAPRVQLSGGSAAIHERVNRALTDGLAIYEVNLKLLADLAPDVIVTQDQCEVCAANLAQVEEAVCAVLPSRPIIVSLKPNSLAEIYADFHSVATAIGRDGEPLVARTSRRIDALAKEAQHPRPRVAFLEWIDPLMGPGLWTPELIEAAGGHALLGAPSEHTRVRAPEALAEADPDIIVVAPCGYTIDDTLKERAVLESLPGWRGMRAVKNGNVAIADGNAYFNRPGPRLADSAEILGAAFAQMQQRTRRENTNAGFVWLD